MKFEARKGKYPQWLDKENDVKNGDTLKITSDVRMIKGNYGEKPVVEVTLSNGDIRTTSLNPTTIDNLSKGCSPESSDWIGLECKVLLGLTPKGNIILILKPII